MPIRFNHLKVYLSAFFLSGSVTVLTPHEVLANSLMDRIMSSWVGATLDDAINQWGFPDEERNIANRRIFVWRDGDGGIGNFANCERMLGVNKNDVVTAVDHKGINCPFMEVGPYARWRKLN